MGPLDILTTRITDALSSYIDKLDWMYILTLILIAYLFNLGANKTNLGKLKIMGKNIKLKTRYRVALVGIIYGIFIYWIRGYNVKEHVEMFISSLTTAIVLHSWIIEWLIEKIEDKTNKAISNMVKK